MPAKWTDDVTCKFVQLYMEHECLWNMHTEIYRNKAARQSALIDICKKMEIENYTINDVKQKIKSLRTTFKQEQRKVEQSERCGAGTQNVYKPAIKWFPLMKDIMKQGTLKQTSQSNWVDCREIEVRSSKPRPRTKIRNESEELISLACKRLRGDRDDLDKLALAWASELRRMSPTQQIFAKKAINDVLIEGQLGTLHRHSVSINVVSPPPPAQNDPTAVANALQSPVEWKTDCQ
ncbi:uncharacterized protein LOC135216112 isoform X3 [Macrobrachium nipponense]|uniref:uncharacterized protein LOC135216112 isoform X3 n=1 Tax=Macrobrachium nipponense TaxID=159736 RepID=UPI0030C8AC87